MWLTASAWLPATLLNALEESASAGDDHALEAAFRQAGPLDEMPPGPVLTTFLSECSAPGPEPIAAQPGAPEPLAARIARGAALARREDNALLGLIRGWRKVASLAAAAELAAVSEFSRRRQEQAKSEGAWDSTAIDAADVELAAALTLTTRGTQLLMDRAAMFHELPATAAALAAGRIDWPKALVLINGLSGQELELARRIEAQLIGRAPQQTTGQLRTALNRALLAADPDAAERRRQTEERHARIERGPEPGGVTALLAGRCLPVTDTVTAWNRITAMARQLRTAGAEGSLDELRVHVYLALLNGQTVTAPAADDVLIADHADDGPVQNAGDQHSPGAGGLDVSGTGLRGSVNLTVPLSTVVGISDGPGHLAGFGPITGHTARHLTSGALGQPSVRWCLTVTGEHGEAVGHACATRIRPIGGPADDSGWLFTMKLSAFAGPECAHGRASDHYRPPPSLWHLIQTRNTCCTAPGCRMPAAVCDNDHTVPFDQGGRTCECNLGPLCRRHHRVKQARGWRLDQPEPGVFAWTTPSGRSYITGPTEHVA
ncbi:MAG TPA: HNH endonuclease signature motif containing protein [Streptosporangiaceae bacterium]|jgi:hypothetical protein|nr:HNH endonuclease signature motif containing protein [Streptosporangiaceae bacterium]